jgi:hypothetical protein
MRFDDLLSYLATPGLYSFLGGAVMWGLINVGINRWYRPEIRAELIADAGCYVSGTRKSGTSELPARFLRLMVRNSGRSSIRDCSGYITSIERIRNSQKIGDKGEVLQLAWAHRHIQQPCRNIPRVAFFYMDIARLEIHGDTKLLCLEEIPSTLAWIFDNKASTFKFNIMIAADNALPFERTVEFEFNPSSDNLRVYYDVSQPRHNRKTT